jgi:hypothetical protein
MFNIVSYKRNANQSNIEIPSLSHQTGNYQDNKQKMLARMQEKRETSYTADGNVN